MGQAAQGAGGRGRGRKKRLTARREFLLDLSFELGIPEEELSDRLTEQSFRLYQEYAERKLLPTRRLQLQLARIAHVSAQVGGANQSLNLSDFLFDPEPWVAEDDLEAAKVAFDFKPRNKKA